MKINLKINKKVGIVLASLVAVSATSNYFSVISKDKNTYDYVYSIPKEITSVGSVVLRMDNIDPSDIYEGQWQLITGNAALKFGDGSKPNLVIEGSNEKTVPLEEHSHGMKHSHQRGTMNFTGTLSAPGYTNVSVGYSLSGTGAFSNSGSKTSLDKVVHNGQLGSVYRSVYFNAKNSWVGSTSSSYESGTTTSKPNTDVSGSDATINVQGATIAVNVWQRIS